MENGPEYVINTDGIDATARMIAQAGISCEEAAELFAKLGRAMNVIIDRWKVKHRHIRYKQIERVRAMMERGQKGK